MSQTTRQPIPTDQELDAITANALPLILQRLRTRRRRRPPSVAVVALVSAATAFGGIAAIHLIPNPDDALAHTDHGAAAAVDCYNDDTTRMVDYLDQGPDSSALRDPIAYCYRQQERLTVQDAVSEEARNLTTAGQHCGTIAVTDGSTWFWTTNTAGGITMTTGRGRWTCSSPVTTITAPSTSATPSVACEHAANWISVYPLHGRTPTQTCRAVGLATIGADKP